MSTSYDPKHIDLKLSTLARWRKSWVELAKRRPWLFWAYTMLCGAASLGFLFSSPSLVGSVGLNVLAGLLFLGGVILFGVADHSASVSDGWLSAVRGAPLWLATVVAWLLLALTLHVIEGAIGNLLGVLLGSTGQGSGSTAQSVDFGAGDIFGRVGRLIAYMSGIFVGYLATCSPVLIMSFVCAFVTSEIRIGLHAYGLFVMRNMRLFIGILLFPMAYQAIQLVGAVHPALAVLLSPLYVIAPTVCSGLIYLIGRESFFGGVENMAPKAASSLSLARSPA